MKEPKVLIGLPIAGHCFPGDTVEALMNMKVVPSIFTRVIAGQPVDKARNAIIESGLKEGFSHILFVDDDNPVPNDTLAKLLEANKDIICAPVLSRHSPFVPCIFEKEEIPGNKLPGYTNILKVDISAGTTIKIDACGMACTLIKREVFEKLWKEHGGKPFEFSRETIKPVDGKTSREMSEDVTFCERATNAGFEIWCDTTIRPKHDAGKKWVQFGDQHLI